MRQRYSNLLDTSNNIVAAVRAKWRLRGAQHVGTRARIWGKAFIRIQGKLVIGARTRLVSTITPLEIVVGPNATLAIGERVFINYGCSIAAMQEVRIGNDCNIGSYVMIVDNNFHHVDPARRLEMPASEPVVIGNNVWLCSRVIVLPGVTIGDDSVVGAGSVVARDIPPRSLAAGVPAKVLQHL